MTPIEVSGPLGYFYNYPIDIDIGIRSSGEKDNYNVEVRVSGTRPDPFQIHVTEHDIASIHLGLQQAIEQVATEFGKNGVHSEALGRLARAGKFAFETIFGNENARAKILFALSMVGMKSGATIEITTKDFLIPWELLYNDDLTKEVKIENFWGMKYIISRMRNDASRSSDLVSPIIPTSRPQVGLVAYHKLRHVSTKEIPLLQGFHQQELIFLKCLPKLKALKRDEDLHQLGNFLSSWGLHIIHFACHAEEKNPISQSCLLISDEFPISLEIYTSERFEVRPDHPLIILNACYTGTISPLYTSNWAERFWNGGARGIIATEFRLPDWFAPLFIEEVYKQFLAGKPIGESLWISRHSFRKQHNPLGLAYSLYSPLAIKIATSDANLLTTSSILDEEEPTSLMQSVSNGNSKSGIPQIFSSVKNALSRFVKK